VLREFEASFWKWKAVTWKSNECGRGSVLNTARAVDSTGVSGPEPFRSGMAKYPVRLSTCKSLRAIFTSILRKRPSYLPRGMIYRFVVDVQTLGELLKRLAEIVGVGDQESTRAFGQLPQAGLCIRGAHRGDGVVALLAVLRMTLALAPSLPWFWLTDAICSRPACRPAGVAGLAHFGGVERVKRDAMAVGIVENLLEPSGSPVVTKPVVTSRTDFLPGSGASWLIRVMIRSVSCMPVILAKSLRSRT